MPRWYRGFRCRSNPAVLLSKIADQVRRHQLGRFVPVVRIEKHVARGSEYFLFTALESEVEGEVPQLVEQTLFRLPGFNAPFPGVFSLDQIRQMVGMEHDVHHYEQRIPYHSLFEPVGDPFDQSLGSALPSSLNPDLESRSLRQDRLLYWLSAQGQGTWESFKIACRALGLAPEIDPPQRVLRRFRLLGHLETSRDGSRWSICPVAMASVALNTAEQTYVLSGQRTLRLTRELENRTRLLISPQEGGSGPARILVHTCPSSDPSSILPPGESTLRPLNVGDAASKLSEVLPDIDAWRSALPTVQGVVHTFYEIKRFNETGFERCQFSHESGMYRLEPGERSKLPALTLFFDDKDNCWRRGDWYGLRFLALNEAKGLTPARFDSTRALLAVPAAERWPETYERALVLSSGRLPVYRDSWLVYEAVSAAVARRLAHKLRIELREE